MKILVVDDDRELLPLISFALRQAGFLALEARTGEETLAAAQREKPDLIILDVNLPGIDGLEVCRRLRESGDRTLILLLTVRSTEEDLVQGLDRGADDYITKPFSPRTLLARVRALLRRVDPGRPRSDVAGDLRIEEEFQAVRLPDGELVRLTSLEFRLMKILAANVGRPVPSDKLLVHVWGSGMEGDRQHLKQLVRRVRQKIETNPAAPERIATIPGVGYQLVSPAPQSGEEGDS
ncbi:MAG TPA: response regulator transcription factor [Planctomycetota bacterium]|nr:response regulator transcription factor [Planctomycetota bacterium]